MVMAVELWIYSKAMIYNIPFNDSTLGLIATVVVNRVRMAATRC
jgi:hypothetical protein